MKKIVIIGASSGIGMRVATDFARLGWRVGIAARREEPLKALKEKYPDRVEYLTIDVTTQDAVERFYKLIELIDGMDYLLYAAGCGWRNPELDAAVDEQTVLVNVYGFTRIINAAYKYYKQTANHFGRRCKGNRHICHLLGVEAISMDIFTGNRPTGPPAACEYSGHRYPTGIC